MAPHTNKNEKMEEEEEEEEEEENNEEEDGGKEEEAAKTRGRTLKNSFAMFDDDALPINFANHIEHNTCTITNDYGIKKFSFVVGTNRKQKTQYIKITEFYLQLHRMRQGWGALLMRRLVTFLQTRNINHIYIGSMVTKIGRKAYPGFHFQESSTVPGNKISNGFGWCLDLTIASNRLFYKLDAAHCM